MIIDKEVLWKQIEFALVILALLMLAVEIAGAVLIIGMSMIAPIFPPGPPYVP